MNLWKKLVTALRLIGRLDGRTIRYRLNYNLGQYRIKRHRHQPFVYTDLGFPFVCHPDWPDSVDHFCTERNRLPSDAFELSLLAAWLEPNDTVIDAGANLGFYSFRAAQAVGAEGRVIAIDAAPYIAGKLTASLRLLALPQVTPLQIALTREPGTVTFYVRPDQAITGAQSIIPSDEERNGSVAVEVPACTFRQLRDQQQIGPALSLIKVDIEGAEGPALESVPSEWFGPAGPLWILEINPDPLARFGYSPPAILAHFPPDTFECWLLAKHPRGPLTRPALRRAEHEMTFDDSIFYNLIALPRGGRWRDRLARLERFFPRAAP